MAENELKVGAGLYVDTRALKCLISHISTELISFRFYLYLKTMPILQTI